MAWLYKVQNSASELIEQMCRNPFLLKTIKFTFMDIITDENVESMDEYLYRERKSLSERKIKWWKIIVNRSSRITMKNSWGGFRAVVIITYVRKCKKTTGEWSCGWLYTNLRSQWIIIQADTDGVAWNHSRVQTMWIFIRNGRACEGPMGCLFYESKLKRKLL